MMIWSIIRGNLKFPRTFDKDGRSLVKHLLVSDLSKRYGNLKNGLLIGRAGHQEPRVPWTRSTGNNSYEKKIKMPYVPVVKGLLTRSSCNHLQLFVCFRRGQLRAHS